MQGRNAEENRAAVPTLVYGHLELTIYFLCRNNERRTAADIQHHLCFICGDMFRDRHEYQKHLITHQSFALVYQIYHWDKTESERKANEKAKKPDPKPGRISHAFSDDSNRYKGSHALRQSEELEREMRQRAKGKSRGVDKLEKSHREERRQYMREKEREEELQAERERQRKIEAARKRRELRKRKLDEHTAMAAMRDQAIPIAKRRPPTRERGMESTPLPSPALPTDPASSSSAQPPAPEVESPRVTNTGYSIGPLQREKCPYCVTRESFNKPVEAIEHIVDHGGSILDVKLSFYDDDKLLATETQLTGEKCNVCDVNFDFPTQYYLHLLLKHRMEVTSFYVPNYPKANNVKFITVMIYRMYPEYTIEFREIMPRPEKPEGQRPQPAGAEAQSTAKEPQPESSKVETEAKSKEPEGQAEPEKAVDQPQSAEIQPEPGQDQPQDQPESTKAEAQLEEKESAT
ncbi:hypothetical protein Y032_0074g819 [Ancylostoma ceylanicum]|uniref:C2H2-type domain-containing protein n=1 Tax=Ancylostoma ceylanicum TaxID=53326 RepID=A0A016TV82_9BILA|nr:hypothetical protein Y032_0074g819 [Ancylostoma ceylanicum]